MKKSLFENQHRGDFNLYEDWVFRYLFSKDTEESRQALMAVLNVILDRREDPITNIELINPHFLGESKVDKESVLDIKAATYNGERIGIEMQNKDLKFFRNRTVYYGGRMVNSALEKGEDYDKMEKSIVISFVNGVLFPNITDMHTEFHLREDRHHDMLSDRLEIHFIELGKVDPHSPVDDLSSVEKLAAYMCYAGDKTKDNYLQELIEDGSEAIMKTEKIFSELTEDKYARAMRDSKLIYELDELTRRNYAIKEGVEEAVGKAVEEAVGKAVAEAADKAAAAEKKALQEAQEKAAEAEKQAVEKGMQALIETLRDMQLPKEAVTAKLAEKFELEEKEAGDITEKYWN